MADSWGTMNPNSTHQLWSLWTFEFTARKPVPEEEVSYNARKFFKQLFHTDAGQVRVSQIPTDAFRTTLWSIDLRIEGPPAHDPDCRESVQKQFTEHFMKRGFKLAQFRSMEVSILAGDSQDGKPPDQLIVMPTLITKEMIDG